MLFYYQSLIYFRNKEFNKSFFILNIIFNSCSAKCFKTYSFEKKYFLID